MRGLAEGLHADEAFNDQRLVSLGSWSCKNALSVALTPRDFGDVAVRGQPSDRDTPKPFS
jgi:hypothetical protein